MKKCRGYKNDNANAIDVTDTQATIDAPKFGVNKFLTTAIRNKPHLITTKSSNCSSIVACKSMVRRTNTTGDGQSSIQKRHIKSFDTTITSTVSTPSFTTTTSTIDTTTTIIVTTSPPSILSIPVVLHSNNNEQHSTMSDIELSTATATAIPTTIAPLMVDNSKPMQFASSMGKRQG